MTKKVILISGGSDGLGKAIATKLTSDHQVVILSHNEEKLKKVSSEINCDFVFADVTDYASLEKAVQSVAEKYQRIDVLINNAGIWTEGPLEEGDPKKIEEVIKVNTLGTIFLSKAVIPTMQKQGTGRILNIISQDGLHAKPEHSVYAASKWAITGFTKCLQMDLSAQNIGVTGIYPGLMKTALFEKQGVARDLSHSLELSEVTNLIEYVINLPSDTLLPEIGIKNINNPTAMDDKTASPIGLDINPDMITTQTGIPTVAPTMSTSDPITPPIPKGVIDITPGVSSDSHPAPTMDITPIEAVQVVTPGINLPVDKGVIDITPDAPPAVSAVPAGASHLTDLLPPVVAEPLAEAQSTPVLSAVPTSGLPELPLPALTDIDSGSTHLTDLLPPATTTPSTTTTPEPVALTEPVTPTPVVTAPPVVKSETPVMSPLYEDPDSVKLTK